jgi:hypothetical protein
LHWFDLGIGGTGRTVIQHDAIVSAHSNFNSFNLRLNGLLENSGTISLGDFGSTGSITFNNGTLLNASDGWITLRATTIQRQTPGNGTGLLANDGMIVVPSGSSSTAQASIANTGTIVVSENSSLYVRYTGLNAASSSFVNTATLLVNGTLSLDTTNGLTQIGKLRGTGTTLLAQVAVVGASSIRQTGLSLDQRSLLTLAPSGADEDCNVVNRLSISSGRLDLNNNDLLSDSNDGTAYSNLRNWIRIGRNNGSWTGTTGVISTAARNDPTHATTLGLLAGAQYKQLYGSTATFDGESFGNNAALVKYTYYGDTDLNGVINFDDYARIDAGFNNHGNTWFQGDFNYDAVVNFDDYALLDLAFNTQSTPLSSPVPESTVLLPGVIALIALRRRCSIA